MPACLIIIFALSKILADRWVLLQNLVHHPDFLLLRRLRGRRWLRTAGSARRCGRWWRRTGLARTTSSRSSRATWSRSAPPPRPWRRTHSPDSSAARPSRSKRGKTTTKQIHNSISKGAAIFSESKIIFTTRIILRNRLMQIVVIF